MQQNQASMMNIQSLKREAYAYECGDQKRKQAIPPSFTCTGF